MAAQRNGGGGGKSAERKDQNGGGEPDVVLDVQKLSVEEITLEVDTLVARIALEARLGDLIYLRVGADAEVQNVGIELKGVEAQAQLQARLDNVLAIMDRALASVDENPEILTELSRESGDEDARGDNGEAPAELEAGSKPKGSRRSRSSGNGAEAEEVGAEKS